MACSGFDAENSRTQFDNVQIQVKNPVLGQLFLDVKGQEIFFDFSDEAFLG
jgi:hypothetical protein